MAQLEKYDESGNRQRVAQLRERGVDVWGPERVYIGGDVPLENIESGASIYQATLTGASLRIGCGSRIGTSGPARIADCQIGRDVELGAGTFEGATFLDGVAVRGFAEVRPGTLLEEQVDCAHNVAFKNTILTATVITGSLINYCDLLMSGGTSRSDHSEVGSGVIHFNFDPRGDKYGSLIGDVTGVLLRSAPIFVGGQCGIVGPIHIDFGTVIAAGSLVRSNVESGIVHFENFESQKVQDFDREIYAGIRRKFLITAKLIGNLQALEAWYGFVRLPYAEDYQKPLYKAARKQARAHIEERITRLEKICDKLERSIEKSSADEALRKFHGEQRRLIDGRSRVRAALSSTSEPAPPDEFLKQYEQARGSATHIDAIRKVDDASAQLAAEWLRQIAARPATDLAAIFA